MDFKVVFYEEFKHIEVEIGKWSIRTDQSIEKGGTGVAPNPGSYLYAAAASCTAATAYGYCSYNNLPLPTGATVHVDEAEDGSRPLKLTFEIHLPAGFPEDRIQAVHKAADACWVKKQWLNPPDFETVVIKGK